MPPILSSEWGRDPVGKAWSGHVFKDGIIEGAYLDYLLLRLAIQTAAHLMSQQKLLVRFLCVEV